RRLATTEHDQQRRTRLELVVERGEPAQLLALGSEVGRVAHLAGPAARARQQPARHEGGDRRDAPRTSRARRRVPSGRRLARCHCRCRLLPVGPGGAPYASLGRKRGEGGPRNGEAAGTGWLRRVAAGGCGWLRGQRGDASSASRRAAPTRETARG